MAKLGIGAEFRAMHHRDKAFVIPSPWDAVTTKLLELIGFKALATSSLGFAVSIVSEMVGTHWTK